MTESYRGRQWPEPLPGYPAAFRVAKRSERHVALAELGETVVQAIDEENEYYASDADRSLVLADRGAVALRLAAEREIDRLEQILVANGWEEFSEPQLGIEVAS